MAIMDQSYAYSQAVESTNALKPGASMDDINSWWGDVHTLYRNDPSGFDEWIGNNPEMGIRWHARAANKNVNTGTDNKVHDAAAKKIAADMGFGGADMKEDGKMIATDYSTFNDVTNEWGAGDFWKIGTPQALPGGFNDFIEDNPLAVAGIAAAVFMPQIAAAIAPTLGVSTPVATGILNAGMTAAGGGDFGDVLKSGLLAYGIADAGNLAKKALDFVPDAAMAAVGDKIMPALQGTSDPGTWDKIVNFATTNAPEIGAVGGVGGDNLGLLDLYSGYNQAKDEYDQYNQDLKSGIPVFQDQPAGLPQNPDAGGADAPSAEEAVPQPDELIEQPSGERNLTLGGPPSTGGFGGSTEGEDEVARAERKRRESQVSGTIPMDIVNQYYADRPTLQQAAIDNQASDFDRERYVRRQLQLDAYNAANPSTRQLSLGGAPGGGGAGGYGGDTGTGSGSGSEPGVQPETPTPEFDWEGLIGLIPQVEQERDPIDYTGPGRDDSYGYERPDYGTVEQASILDLPARGIQAPMVQPAANSGQPGFDEWAQQYGQDQDIMSIIAQKRTDKGRGLI